jgi:hypothetical protein
LGLIIVPATRPPFPNITPEGTPHNHAIARRANDHAQVLEREKEVADHDVLHIPITLNIFKGQGQYRAHHGAAVRASAVEDERGIRNLHFLIHWIKIIYHGINGPREVVRGASVIVHGSRRDSGEIGGRGKEVVANLGFQDIGNQNMLAFRDKQLIIRGKVNEATRLDQRA